MCEEKVVAAQSEIIRAVMRCLLANTACSDMFITYKNYVVKVVDNAGHCNTLYTVRNLDYEADFSG